MPADDILKLKLKRLQSEPEEFSNKVKKAQDKIFDKVQKSLKKLSTNNGTIELTQENFAKINEILADYESAIKGSGYYNDLKDFVGEFGKQKELNDKFLELTLDDYEPKSHTDLIYKLGEKTATTELGMVAVNNSTDLLRSMINNSVVSGDNILDLTENVSLSIKGNSKIDGTLFKTAKLKSTDIYAASERSYTAAISNEFGIQFYQYAGGEMDTTRCFCKERHGKIYHKKEIEAWGRHEQLGKCNIGNGWAGMIKGTNETTIFTFAGGYSCHHTFVPKGLKDVSTAVLKMAIDNGYINIEELPESVRSRVE